MIKKAVLAVCGLFASIGAAQAGTLQIGINDYSAELVVTQALIEDRQGVSEVYGRALYNSDDDTTLGEVGLDVLGSPEGLQGLQLGIGGHFFGADIEQEDVFAVALGGIVRLNPADFSGVGARFRIFYAPNILSFGECERLFETGFEVEYEFMPRARVFVGYGNTKVNTELKGSIRADESIRGGVVFAF